LNGTVVLFLFVLSSCNRHMLLFILFLFFSSFRPPPRSTLFPYTTLFRSDVEDQCRVAGNDHFPRRVGAAIRPVAKRARNDQATRSEEHTSELQSHLNLVCRLLLEKKKRINSNRAIIKQCHNSCFHYNSNE